MKRLAAIFIACLLSASAVKAAPEQPVNLLQEDWDTALSKAADTGHYLYVAFLGEGWSVACKRLSEEILETDEFQAFADENLVYCPVLARRSPKLSKEETARLQALVIHFDIKAYPTIILLAPDGTEVLRHGYRDESVNAYLKLLGAIIDPY